MNNEIQFVRDFKNQIEKNISSMSNTTIGSEDMKNQISDINENILLSNSLLEMFSKVFKNDNITSIKGVKISSDKNKFIIRQCYTDGYFYKANKANLISYDQKKSKRSIEVNYM